MEVMKFEEKRFSIGDLIYGLQTVMDKIDGVDENAIVLWTEDVHAGDKFNEEFDVDPGSLLLGIRYMKDNKIQEGTIRISPKKLTKFVS